MRQPPFHHHWHLRVYCTDVSQWNRIRERRSVASQESQLPRRSLLRDFCPAPRCLNSVGEYWVHTYTDPKYPLHSTYVLNSLVTIMFLFILPRPVMTHDYNNDSKLIMMKWLWRRWRWLQLTISAQFASEWCLTSECARTMPFWVRSQSLLGASTSTDGCTGRTPPGATEPSWSIDHECCSDYWKYEQFLRTQCTTYV